MYIRKADKHTGMINHGWITIKIKNTDTVLNIPCALKFAKDGMALSIIPISLENRAKILPMGFES